MYHAPTRTETSYMSLLIHACSVIITMTSPFLVSSVFFFVFVFLILYNICA